MKPITSFAQLLLRFKVRDFTRRQGRKPTRTEYARIQYQSNPEKRREDKRRSLRKRIALEIIDEVCKV